MAISAFIGLRGASRVFTFVLLHRLLFSFNHVYQMPHMTSYSNNTKNLILSYQCLSANSSLARAAVYGVIDATISMFS
jgi:hypothetical protein